MKKIFLIDNYDSFTYNLLYYVEELGCEITVKRNDKFELDEIKHFDAILISPGPGIPSEAGKILDVIKMYYDSKNIFGVCLGQQAIAEAFVEFLVRYHLEETVRTMSPEQIQVLEGLANALVCP